MLAGERAGRAIQCLAADVVNAFSRTEVEDVAYGAVFGRMDAVGGNQEVFVEGGGNVEFEPFCAFGREGGQGFFRFGEGAAFDVGLGFHIAGAVFVVFQAEPFRLDEGGGKQEGE